MPSSLLWHATGVQPEQLAATAGVFVAHVGRQAKSASAGSILAGSGIGVCCTPTRSLAPDTATMHLYVVASCLAASSASWLAAVLSTPLVLPASATGREHRLLVPAVGSEAADPALRHCAASCLRNSSASVR